MSAQEQPTGEVVDNDYTSRTGQKDANVPVQSDNDTVEDPIDAETADTDAQLGESMVRVLILENRSNRHAEKDDKEAIDKSNIIEERTRGAAQPKGSYQEPGDEEGMPKE